MTESDVPGMCTGIGGPAYYPPPEVSSHERPNGTLGEEGPYIIHPAKDVLSLVAWDNTTIDMSFEQALAIADDIIDRLRGDGR